MSRFSWNNIVGTFALVMDNLSHLEAVSGIVEDVAVDPGLQGRGVGKAMMAYAIFAGSARYDQLVAAHILGNEFKGSDWASCD